MNKRIIIVLSVISLFGVGLLSVFFFGSQSKQSITSNASTSIERSSQITVDPSFTSSATSQAIQSPQSTPASKANLFRSSTISELPTGTGAARTEELGGTPAIANVKVGKNNLQLIPNEAGMFPRVLVPANGKVQISVAYPEGTPEDPLVIQAEDGGVLNGKAVIQQGKLDADRNLSFEFQTNEERGVYRVSLRKGMDQKWLDFWVGEELQLKNKS